MKKETTSTSSKNDQSSGGEKTKSKPHWSFKIIGNIAAIIIGIDCAINAWYYMALMGGFFAVPAVIAICALAGFILNTILYSADFPEAFDGLYKSITTIFTLKTETDASKTAEDKDTKHPVETFLSEIIAISSGVVMGLFTYSSYLGLAIPHISLPLILLLSIANTIGTYGLLRTSLEIGQLKDDIWEIKEKHIKSILVATLFIIYVLGTVWTLNTWVISAITVIPQINYFVAYTPLLLGELAFVLGTAIKTINYIIPGSNSEALATHNTNTVYFFILVAFSVLNAVGNGAITAAGGPMYKAVIGALLSLGVMIKASMDQVKANDSADAADSSTKLTCYAMISMLAIWSFLEFVQPAVAASIGGHAIAAIIGGPATITIAAILFMITTVTTTHLTLECGKPALEHAYTTTTSLLSSVTGSENSPSKSHEENLAKKSPNNICTIS